MGSLSARLSAAAVPGEEFGALDLSDDLPLLVACAR